jgi:hypothetical protein
LSTGHEYQLVDFAVGARAWAIVGWLPPLQSRPDRGDRIEALESGVD